MNDLFLTCCSTIHCAMPGSSFLREKKRRYMSFSINPCEKRGGWVGGWLVRWAGDYVQERKGKKWVGGWVGGWVGTILPVTLTPSGRVRRTRMWVQFHSVGRWVGG